MKRKTMSPEAQKLKEDAWKHICDWHNENPLYLVGAGVCLILLALGTAIHFRNEDAGLLMTIVISVIASEISLFCLCRWYVKEVLCRSLRYQQKCFHKKAVH